MKKCLQLISLLFLTVFSIQTFAEKIVIDGQPVVITKEGEAYVPSTTLAPTSDYYYFSMDNSRRVCYRTVQPALSKIDAGALSVRIGGDTVQVHCYDVSPDYFTVTVP